MNGPPNIASLFLFPSPPFPSHNDNNNDLFSSLLCPAKKGVTFVLLIRLGMLWGRDKGAYDRGIFGGSWGCHSKEHMSALYEELKSKLEHKHYGPFDALSLLMGDRNARIFAERLRRPRRPVIAP